MTPTTASPLSTAAVRPFVEALRHRSERVFSALPTDVRARREDLLNRFLDRGIPTHRDEEWKYTSLRLLAETSFGPRPMLAACPDRVGQIPGLGDGPTLVFWNGDYCPDLSKADLPVGVRFSPLSDAPTPPPFGEIAVLAGKLGSSNDDRFTWLNGALFEDGVLLELDENAIAEDPIQLVFLSGGETPTLSFPRVYVRAGAHSQAKIVEYHVGEGPYASISVAEFDVAESAIVEHTRIQDESPVAFHLSTVAVRQAKNSTYTNTNVQFGGRIGRIEANVWVGGEHAETWLNGVYVGTQDQHLDNHTRIDHALPNCHSFEVYKGILDGHATGVFNGKIFVYQDAQKTDAKQTNQALLLSPTAAIDTKPQLEIFADDVKCTHGATIGQLRDDAMFYLRSRGIPEAEAKNLLVYAFAAEGLDRISIEPLKNALEARLFEKLGVAGKG